MARKKNPQRSSNWGGRREGAGQKKQYKPDALTHRLSIAVSNQTAEQIQEVVNLHERQGQKLSVNQLVNDALGVYFQGR